MEKDIIGFKDMHSDQITELMDFIAHSLTLANALAEEVDDEEIFDDAKSRVESLIEMLGGQALITDQTSLESTDLEQG